MELIVYSTKFTEIWSGFIMFLQNSRKFEVALSCSFLPCISKFAKWNNLGTNNWFSPLQIYFSWNQITDDFRNDPIMSCERVTSCGIICSQVWNMDTADKSQIVEETWWAVVLGTSVKQMGGCSENRSIKERKIDMRVWCLVFCILLKFKFFPFLQFSASSLSPRWYSFSHHMPHIYHPQNINVASYIPKRKHHPHLSITQIFNITPEQRMRTHG